MPGITKYAQDWVNENSPRNKLLDSVPESGDFNPYDFIDVNNYKNTERGRMEYQQDLAKLLYMAQIIQEDKLNEYNSPVEQVKRQKQAGLNPDLIGVENHGATNVAGYQGNPMDGTKSIGQQFGDVVGVISSVTSMITGLVSGVQGIFGSGLELFGKSLSNTSSLFDLFDKSTPFSSSLDGSNWLSSFPMSRRVRRQLKSAMSSYSQTSGFENNFTKFLTDVLESRGQFNKASLTDRNSSDVDIYTAAWKPYIEALEKYSIDKLKGDSARSNYDEGYYGNAKGQEDASFEQDQRNIFRQFKKPLAEVMENFDKIENEELRYLAKAALAGFIMSKLAL